MEHYCVKCKKAQQVNSPQESVTRNNRRILKGRCTACGSVVCKILGKASSA